MKPIIDKQVDWSVNAADFAEFFLQADSEQQAAVLLEMMARYETNHLEMQMLFARDDMREEERSKVCEMLRMMASMIEGPTPPCEHGVADGEYCEPCNREYKRAAVESEVEDRSRQPGRSN